MMLSRNVNSSLFFSKFIPSVCRRTVAAQPNQHSLDQKLFKRLPPSSLQQKTVNPLAYRKYLPGSQSDGLPKYLANPREGLPLALKVETADQRSITELARQSRKALDEVLPTYGVVLFRGLPIDSANGFGEYCEGLGYEPMGYEGGTGNRDTVDGEERVYTSTEDPKEFTNELHNEMACSPIYPKKVIFYCLQAPKGDCGGLTPFARNTEVFASLDKEIVKTLRERKIRYLRYLPDQSAGLYTSWQQSFITEDRQEVEKFLENAQFEYQWDKSDGSLAYWYILPPIVSHPVSGKPIWFTQPQVHHNTYYKESPMFEGIDLPNHMYPTHTTYGDGEEFEPEVIQHIRDISWKCAVGFQWQNRDVLVLDNLLAMHGKLSFTGERKILAYLIGN